MLVSLQLHLVASSLLLILIQTNLKLFVCLSWLQFTCGFHRVEHYVRTTIIRFITHFDINVLKSHTSRKLNITQSKRDDVWESFSYVLTCPMAELRHPCGPPDGQLRLGGPLGLGSMDCNDLVVHSSLQQLLLQIVNGQRRQRAHVNPRHHSLRPLRP